MEDKDKRVTLIKTQVGKVKTSAYELPSKGFVYGCKSRHEESVGDLIGKWSVSHPHEYKAKKSFITHPEHQHHGSVGYKHHSYPSSDFIYGKKTQL
jgi:hypothetical protein